MMSFGQFAAHLERALVELPVAVQGGLANVGEHAKTVAVEYIGREMPDWQPLSEATMQGFRHPLGFWVKGKVELGYTGQVSATDPLLRTGKLEHSISLSVEPMQVVVGSTDKVALWQELGTHNSMVGNIPPRPFLAPAMMGAGPFAGEVFGEIAVKLLTPGLIR